MSNQAADDTPAPKRRVRTFRAGTRHPFLALETTAPPHLENDDPDLDPDHDEGV